jgi:SIR2-like domain
MELMEPIEEDSHSEIESSPIADVDLLKVREMPDLVRLEATQDDLGETLLKPTTKARGLKKAVYRLADLREEIEPWLTALFQSDHLSVLVGAGLTTAIHKQINRESPSGFTKRSYAAFDDQIQQEAARSARASDRGEPNAEDQLRAALSLREGLRILLASSEDAGVRKNVSLRKQCTLLTKDISKAIQELLIGVLRAEQSIRPDAHDLHEEALRTLLSFLMSFASRTGTRDRLHVFTTNYDRVLEFGAELAGLRLIDRFVGSLSPIFRSSRLDVDFHYNPPGIRGEPRYLEGVAKFTKLHGSLDWIKDEREVRRRPLPFGAIDHEPFLGNDPNRSLIYPNDAKDQETASYPYVELFRDFAAALCRPNSTLVTYGYSFGDEHINRVIVDMLAIPSTHVVMINYDDTGRRLSRFYERAMRRTQVSMLVGNHLGDLRNLVDYYLPKPAIDRATIRMEQLLRARGYTTDYDEQVEGTEASFKEEPQ